MGGINKVGDGSPLGVYEYHIYDTPELLLK